MASNRIFFKPTYNALRGYYIPVRNSWNYHIIKKHISEKEKHLYEKEFGEEIIDEEEFFSWWKKVRYEYN
jgi:hypothetical protein